jgi:hypothetical protein
MERETSIREGAGNIEVPASPARVKEERMKVRSECDTTDRRTVDHGIVRDEKS